MGRKFHKGFVGIPTDLFSDPSTCGVGYGKERFSEMAIGEFKRKFYPDEMK
ncbi:hypothetical protein LEP1GSC188_2494 [Leptospira weilii serovar Topaz str. LT2116]|uniref:Uncharacterized protein n=1 Tax=Leptospira weilii serovar Topaz str. LT2116 TaxID=1088540 RepID=M3FIA4_9LEPT|nr:hypothetical protein LEP1GSC188_2494 [Leptospira weilii serovar Topaz str. LT2116]